MKKLICIYLVLVMVMTGCGKTIYILGIDSILEKQDEYENSVIIISATSKPTPEPTLTPTPAPKATYLKIVDPTPKPTPTPSPTTSPSPTPDLTPILINEAKEQQWIFEGMNETEKLTPMPYGVCVDFQKSFGAAQADAEEFCNSFLDEE